MILLSKSPVLIPDGEIFIVAFGIIAVALLILHLITLLVSFTLLAVFFRFVLKVKFNFLYFLLFSMLGYFVGILIVYLFFLPDLLDMNPYFNIPILFYLIGAMGYLIWKKSQIKK